MKKHLPSFLAGVLSAAVVTSLVAGALAVSGQVSFQSSNVQVLNKTIQAGETFIGENGQQIPGAITYTDEAGGSTVYVSLRKMAELLDAPIYWDSDKQTAVLGDGFAPPEPPTFVIGATTDPDREELPSTPELGVKAGGFTEVAPVDRSKISGGFHIQPQAETRYSNRGDGLNNMRYEIFEPHGNYVEITVTNHGEPVRFMVGRPYFTSYGVYGESFTTVGLDTGETLTRAFYMEPGTEFPKDILRLDIDLQDHSATGNPDDALDITFSVTQYEDITID